MAEVKFRIPSRTVEYGFIEVKRDVPEDASAEMLAAQYVNYVYAFQKEEEATIDRLKAGQDALVEASEEADEAMHQEAVGRLSEGLSATVVSEEEPPWKQEVASKKKPWETDEAAPKAASEDW